MQRLLWVLCFSFSITSMGCFRWLDEVRRDSGHLSKLGASAKARQIESDMDWGPSF